MSSLTIGYSTLAESIENIQLPDIAKHINWDVLITVQSGTDQMPTAEQLAKAPSGDHVKVLAYPGRGVTKIRNKVIENASGDFLIFGDDDIVFNEEGLSRAIQIMKDQQLTLLLGQAVDDLGTLRKQYPSSKAVLTKFNSGKAATYEMVVDVSAVRSSGVRFDEEFGAGAEENYLGDEYIFIADLLSVGLVCQFEPLVLATHPTDSSGSGWGTKRDRIARARIFDRVFRGNKTLPFLARAAFGARKIGKGLTLRTWLLFTFGK